MKHHLALAVSCASALYAALPTASAAVVIDWVTVGNPGNAAQSPSNRNHAESGGDGYGAVAYDYQIGEYEVTNAQYGDFLNAVAHSRQVKARIPDSTGD